MLRTNTRVVQPRCDRVNRQRITFTVLQVITFKAMDRPLTAKRQGGRMFICIQAFSGGLNTDELNIFITEKSSKQADCI